MAFINVQYLWSNKIFRVRQIGITSPQIAKLAPDFTILVSLMQNIWGSEDWDHQC